MPSVSGTEARTRILMIDDNAEIVAVVKEYLESRPVVRYVVEAASNGADGLQAVRRRRPDLVILDVDMPGMNGVEVLKRIRALDPTVPVIMLTGTDDVAVAAQILKEGASSYAPKPLNFKYLDHLVAMFVSRAERPLGG